MKTLNINQAQAVKLFKQTREEFQQTLISTFGAECFNEKITDRIKTFEDACNHAGIDRAMVFNATDTPDVVAYKKIKVIVSVLNEGWKPNWKDYRQDKWFIYAYYGAYAGLWYAYAISTPAIASTSLGSRVCFHSEELADYFGRQFFDLYKEFIIG